MDVRVSYNYFFDKHAIDPGLRYPRPPRNAVPMDFDGKVTISGMPDIRSDIDDPDPVSYAEELDRFIQRRG